MLNKMKQGISTFLISIMAWGILSFAVMLSCVSLAQAGDLKMEEVAQAEHLIQVLESPTKREELVSMLRGLSKVSETKTESFAFVGFVSWVTDKTISLTKDFLEVLPAVKLIPAQYKTFFEKIWLFHLGSLLHSLGGLVLACGVGFCLELVFRRSSRKLRKDLLARCEETWTGRHLKLMLNGVFSIVPVVVSYAGALVTSYGLYMASIGSVFGFRQSHPQEAFLGVFYILFFVLAYRTFIRVAEAIFSPKDQSMRYLMISEAVAEKFFSPVRLALLVGCIGFGFNEFAGVWGLEEQARILLSRCIGLVILVCTLYVIIDAREDVSRWLKAEFQKSGNRISGLRELTIFIADIWHVVVSVSVFAIYLKWSVNPESGHQQVVWGLFATAAIIVAMKLAGGWAEKLIKRLCLLGNPKNTNHQMAHLDAILHTVIHCIGFVCILNAWGLDLMAMIQSSASGENTLVRLFTILGSIIVGVVLWESVNKVIEDQLSPMVIEGEAYEPTQRARTLLPIIRNVAKWLIVVVVSIMILAELGFNVMTLIAGFGIFGLAVAMGSQRLAQDVMTGIFILMENAIEVGDVISVGGVTGAVEDFTIRTLILRNISGERHTIPYSSIGSISNISRDFRNSIMDISVGYDADLPQVIKVFEEVGAEMKADQNLAPKVLEDLVVVGVSKISETSISIMSVMKTEPDPYHLVDLDFRRRIKMRFAELGIPQPSIRQRVAFAIPQNGEASLSSGGVKTS